MAAYAATYFDSGRSSSRRIEERNARLFAEQQRLRRGATLEVFFPKRIDNSRLVKAPDTVRIREMRIFTAAVTVLFSLVMFYGLQHFSAIEMGYSVEAKKQQVEALREQNRQLRLSEAQLSQPRRIDSHGAADGPGRVAAQSSCARDRPCRCQRRHRHWRRLRLPNRGQPGTCDSGDS
jgi:hypothetical protein